MPTPQDQALRTLALREELLGALRPFMTGAPGASPLTDAAVEAFKIKTLPIIQQQMTLKGLGHSPATAQVAGETLALALPDFIEADMANRINAVNLANAVGNTQGQFTLGSRDIGLREALDPRRVAVEERGAGVQERGIALQELVQPVQLGQTAAKLMADIANTEAMRGLEAYRTAGQLSLGLGDVYTRAAQLQQEQQRMALQAGGAAGALQRDIAQQTLDAVQQERLRQQGLAEAATTGLFGGQVLPSTLQTKSTTRQSSSK